MAFIRRKRRGDKSYFALVENYRDAGKVKQRVILHLPTLDLWTQLLVQADGEIYRRFGQPDPETELRVKTVESSTMLSSIDDAIDIYSQSYYHALTNYRWAVVGLQECQKAYGRVAIQEFEKLDTRRAEVFRWYRTLKTLEAHRESKPSDREFRDDISRRTSRTRRENAVVNRVLDIERRRVRHGLAARSRDELAKAVLSEW